MLEKSGGAACSVDSPFEPKLSCTVESSLRMQGSRLVDSVSKLMKPSATSNSHQNSPTLVSPQPSSSKKGSRLLLKLRDKKNAKSAFNSLFCRFCDFGSVTPNFKKLCLAKIVVFDTGPQHGRVVKSWMNFMLRVIVFSCRSTYLAMQTSSPVLPLSKRENSLDIQNPWEQMSSVTSCWGHSLCNECNSKKRNAFAFASSILCWRNYTYAIYVRFFSLIDPKIHSLRNAKSTN